MLVIVIYDYENGCRSMVGFRSQWPFFIPQPQLAPSALHRYPLGNPQESTTIIPDIIIIIIIIIITTY